MKKADFNFCDWAKDSFTLFDAERDGAENPYIQEFSLNFRGQYQGALVDPAGGTDRLKGGADGRDKRDNNEWRRFRLGAPGSIFFFTLPRGSAALPLHHRATICRPWPGLTNSVRFAHLQ